MERQVIPNDVHVTGRLTAGTMTVAADSVSNGSVVSTAAIQAEKLEHRHHKTLGQEATANAAAEERIIHVARGAGTLEEFTVGLITPPDTALASGRSAIVDLKKNGTTILSAPVTLSSTNAFATPVAGAIASAAYVVGDRFTIAITLGGGSTGTHAKGVYGQMTAHEFTP